MNHAIPDCVEVVEAIGITFAALNAEVSENCEVITGQKTPLADRP